MGQTHRQTNWPAHACPIPIFMVPALCAGPFHIFTLTAITCISALGMKH